jgi:hypothetical protein
MVGGGARLGPADGRPRVGCVGLDPLAQRRGPARGHAPQRDIAASDAVLSSDNGVAPVNTRGREWARSADAARRFRTALPPGPSDCFALRGRSDRIPLRPSTQERGGQRRDTARAGYSADPGQWRARTRSLSCPGRDRVHAVFHGRFPAWDGTLAAGSRCAAGGPGCTYRGRRPAASAATRRRLCHALPLGQPAGRGPAPQRSLSAPGRRAAHHAAAGDKSGPAANAHIGRRSQGRLDPGRIWATGHDVLYPARRRWPLRLYSAAAPLTLRRLSDAHRQAFVGSNTLRLGRGPRRRCERWDCDADEVALADRGRVLYSRGKVNLAP